MKCRVTLNVINDTLPSEFEHTQTLYELATDKTFNVKVLSCIFYSDGTFKTTFTSPDVTYITKSLTELSFFLDNVTSGDVFFPRVKRFYGTGVGKVARGWSEFTNIPVILVPNIPS